MQYRVQQGINRSPIEQVTTFVATLPKRNWLPAGVASLMVLWISLIIANVMQGLPADIGAPTSRPPASGPMQVTTASTNNGNNLAVTNSDGSMTMANGQRATPTPSNDNIASVTSPSTTQPAPSTDTVVEQVPIVPDIIGGRGGDEGGDTSGGTLPEVIPPAVTNPVEEVTQPIVEDVVQPITQPLQPILEVVDPIVQTTKPVLDVGLNIDSLL